MAGSAIIGALRVSLGLDSAQFTQGVKQAQKVSAGLSKSFAALGAAIPAIGGALTAITVSVARSGAEISRLSKVANAAPETFQRWAAGAETVGIQQEKLADILKDTTDRVGDFAATGGGPMADFFENIAPKVGVTIDQFRRLSGPEALQLYISSLEKAGASQQDMTFYLEAMASDATLLLPLLANGGAEMDRLGQRAASLGAVLDANTIAAMQRTQVALQGVGLVFTGIRNQIGVEFAPALAAVANGFTNAMMAGQPLAEAIRLMIDNMARLGTYLVTAAGLLIGKFVVGMGLAAAATFTLSGALAFLRVALIRTGIGAIVVLAGELIYQFVLVSDSVGGIGKALDLLAAVAREVFDRIVLAGSALERGLVARFHGIRAEWLTSLASMAAGFSTFASKMGSAMMLIPGLQTGGASLLSMAAGDFGLQGAADAAYSSMMGAAAAADALGVAASRPLKSIAALNDAVEKNAEVTDKSAASLAGLNGQLAETAGEGGGSGGGAPAAAGAVDEITDAMRAAEQSADQLKEGFRSAFTSFVTGAQSARDAASQLLGTLADMLANSAFESLVGGAGGDSFFSSIGSLLGFANGTPYAPGGLAMVGERGPELVNLPRGSQVYTNRETEGLMSGGAVELIIHADPGVSIETVRNEAGAIVRQSEPGIVSRAKSAMMRDMSDSKMGWAG